MAWRPETAAYCGCFRFNGSYRNIYWSGSIAISTIAIGITISAIMTLGIGVVIGGMIAGLLVGAIGGASALAVGLFAAGSS